MSLRGCENLALTALPTGVTSIGYSAFHGCDTIALIALPAGLTELGAGAFNGLCNNVVITSIPEGITTINSSIFSTDKITQISLPAGVTLIKRRAFVFLCSNNLATVICNAPTPPTLEKEAFHHFIGGRYYIKNSFTIKVPAGSVAAYKAAPGWSDYADRITSL